MSAAAWPFPGLVWGPYPQARAPVERKRREVQLRPSAVAACARQLHAQRSPARDLDGALASLRAVAPARRDDAWLREALQASAAAMEQVRGVRGGTRSVRNP